MSATARMPGDAAGRETPAARPLRGANQTAGRPAFTEHDHEPIPGLPGQLPEGERVLWQGAPAWQGIARRGLHLKGIAAYFALLALWRGAALTADGAGFVEASTGAAFLLALGSLPILLLMGFAWASARSTLYTVTTRRIVVRTGVALPMTVNIPFAVIGGAEFARHGDGTGDIALGIMKPHRISWVALWPHVRPWRFLQPQPMLRAVDRPEEVAQLLGRALAAAASQAPRTRPVPVPAASPASDAPAAA